MRGCLVVTLLLTILSITACSSTYTNRTPTEEFFPSVSAKDLNDRDITVPDDLKGDLRLLLIGYVQDAQFDIDRWLIGLDMTNTNIAAYELPTISGMFPRMFKDAINNGMRAGIPKQLWGGVITIYDGAEKVKQLTGTQNPNNARVIILNQLGNIIYFYDEGFSVKALNEVMAYTNAKDDNHT